MSHFIYTMKGLGKIYPPDQKVFEDIWLSFIYGAKIGIIGGNGAGKSTLMHTLAGAHPADSGQILVNGQPVTIHNLYVPAGGDEPDPKINEKFAHKLQFIDELEAWFGKDCVPKGHESVLVGDLNIAPLEHDVWSHKDLLKVVSHTPVETGLLDRVLADGKWTDVMRQHVPADRKLYTWWSYRAKDWAQSDRGRRLDHVWSSAALAARSKGIEVVREARSWPRASDHVPVIASFSAEI